MLLVGSKQWEWFKDCPLPVPRVRDSLCLPCCLGLKFLSRHDNHGIHYGRRKTRSDEKLKEPPGILHWTGIRSPNRQKVRVNPLAPSGGLRLALIMVGLRLAVFLAGLGKYPPANHTDLLESSTQNH